MDNEVIINLKKQTNSIINLYNNLKLECLDVPYHVKIITLKILNNSYIIFKYNDIYNTILKNDKNNCRLYISYYETNKILEFDNKNKYYFYRFDLYFINNINLHKEFANSVFIETADNKICLKMFMNILLIFCLI